MLTAPTVTGWSGFWQLQGDKSLYSMSQSQGRYKHSKRISQFINNTGGKDVAAALAVLVGATAGGTITATWPQVPVPPGPNMTPPQVTGVGDLGGNRVAVTNTVINRASTAGDVTELKKWFSTALLEMGITYPTVLGPPIARGMMRANMPGFA